MPPRIHRIPNGQGESLRYGPACRRRRSECPEGVDRGLDMNAIPSWGADPVRVGCVGSEAVQNDPVICSRACLIDHAGIVRSLHPILDSTASVPRGHPRQPGRRWRSGNGLIVVGLGEDRLGVDVHEPARQVVLRRKLGKQGRALYPVRLSALSPLAIVRGHLMHGAAIRRVVLIGTLFRSEQADQFTASEVIRLSEREETLALVVCVYDGRAMLHSV